MHGFPNKCARCGTAPLLVSSMSRMNTDILCMPCLNDEKDCPGFQAAYEAEHAEVLKGNYSFEGVGLTDEDRAFLTQRISTRS